ncbi:MAG: hypothetical protein K5694_05870 [Bacilli bacterium]|nr:hypothetical protein [Bacilli bacterium]
MKKNSGLFPLLGMVLVLATLGVFLFPLGPGLVDSTGTAYVGYNFVFGNPAAGYVQPNGAYIAVFVLSIISAVFQVAALVFSFGHSGRKFAGFLYFLSGLMMIVNAILLFLAVPIIGDFLARGGIGSGVTFSLGWGFIAAGACAAVGALLGIYNGFTGMKSK